MVDRDLRLVHVGSSLANHSEVAVVGAPFASCVAIERPECEVASFDDLVQLAGLIVIARVPGLAVPLRGAIFLIAGGAAALVAAVPILKSQEELAASQLTLSDFAPQDSLPDLLFAVQARDVSIREATESCRRQAEATSRLKSILDSALDAMITIDVGGNVVEFNNVACDMFGYSREGVVGRPLHELILPAEARQRHLDGLARFRETGEGPRLNRRIELTAQRSDGTAIPVAAAIIPFEHDGAQYFTATMRDLTERKQREEALALAAEREHLLQRELDHRVKNMLAQILTLCRHAEDGASADLSRIEALTQRIEGFSHVHDLLSRERATGVSMADLVQLCLVPYAGGELERVAMEGEAVLIRPRAAMTIAMVLNELATNAVKHGGLRGGGCVRVQWAIDRGEQPCFVLGWREQSDGPGVTSLDGGFGVEVVRAAIPHELGGTVSLEPCERGLCFEARIPLAAVQ